MPNIEHIDAAGLRSYLAKRKEKEYLLIDVRQPEEYGQGHIPGARLIPLMDLIRTVDQLPNDRDLIFYCHSGARSMSAAAVTAEEFVTPRPLMNLTGGMLAWDGRSLPGFPRIEVFQVGENADDLLYTAMDLEKGAWRFYQHLVETFAEEPYGDTYVRLSKAETAHAGLIYRHWAATQKAPPAFEQLFADLKGEILEGGQRLDDLLERLPDLKGNTCLNVMELALTIEYTAYDLYRTMAADAADGPARQTFLEIAQAEKSHMQSLAAAIAKCPQVVS